MIKSQPDCLGPGFELETSQIRVQCVTIAPPHSETQFLFRRISSRYRFCCKYVKEENALSVGWRYQIFLFSLSFRIRFVRSF